MGLEAIIFGIAVLAVLIYVGFIYNQLVSLKHHVAKAWANIEVLLKQRHEELPKLVEVCRQYLRYEQDTLTAVMEARAKIAGARERRDLKSLGQAETELQTGLNRLFAVAEAYPELRANERFQHLEARITGLESAIADRREFYNETVNQNNVRIEQLPDALIARLFSFQPFELLKFSKAETQDVNLKALFG